MQVVFIPADRLVDLVITLECYYRGYPYLHDASANKNAHVSNASIAVCVFASISKKQRGLSSSRTTASTSTET